MPKLAYPISSIFIAFALLFSGCKSRPNIPWFGEKKSPNTGDAQVPGGEQADAPDTAAITLYDSIVAGLKAQHAGEENKTWFASKSLIEGEWLADSPKTYWNIEASKLPKDFACEAGNIGCDLVFERRLCNTQADCDSTNTMCQELFASVSKPGEMPKKMCLGSGDKVIDDYYGTMVKTEKHLEISSLTLPSGRFYKAMINALAFLSHKNPSTGVRILISSVSGLVPQNLVTKPKSVLDDIVKDILKANGDSKKLRMNLAYLYKINLLKPKDSSWNHTKIILADSNHILQGGHNFLDPDYVSTRPIFDLSMHASGSAGIGVQKFVDEMWAKADPVASNLEKGEKVLPPSTSDSNVGKTLTIGMGRMGHFGANSSDDGFNILLKTAKKSIILAQQDLFNNIDTIGTPEASHALPALIDAIFRGLNVKIAQSSSTKLLGYGTVSPEEASKLVLKAVMKEAADRKFVPPAHQTLGEYLCEKLEYAPFIFSESIMREWPEAVPASGGKKENQEDRLVGVHPKLIIVDETGFYLGSQNFYPSNLQEFGLFVSDSRITRQILDQYWNKIWVNSSKHKMPCR